VGPVLTRCARIGAALAIVCAALAAPAGAAARWVPPQKLTWYWQLAGTPKVEPVQATDMDGFDHSAATVAGFHARGQRAICYLDVGTWENWRPDAGQFPSTVLGASNGWPGEQWLDVGQLSALAPIMSARLQMCAQKGFDAVEPDNMDGYQNSTGFSITAAQQLAYNQWIAQEAHALGMAVFQKNDPDQAGELQPSFDGVIDEQCNEYSECSAFQPYVAAGKPVLDAEYQASSYPGFCSADQSAGIMGALYALALDGSVYRPCFAPVTTTPLPAAPAPAPAPGATPKAAGPQKAVRALEIRSGRLVLRRGAVSIRLACPRGRGACAGTVQLFTAARAVRLGRAHFRLAGATSRAVRMKLSKQRLHRLHRRSVRVVVRVADRNVRARPSRMSRTAILALHPRHRRHHR
jgi:hypothetical protein